tara:strand:+ start:849 stop:1082 length:234 start_codon:yes stop_codon:yes gene_type:complete
MYCFKGRKGRRADGCGSRRDDNGEDKAERLIRLDEMQLSDEGQGTQTAVEPLRQEMVENGRWFKGINFHFGASFGIC